MWYNPNMPRWLRRLNVLSECRALDWGLWQCPPFLYLVMGFITIIAMIATYFFSSRYFLDEPEIAALVVIAVTILLFILGNLIISGFNNIAEANRMKTEFVSIVSHQLRSPLSISKWTLGLLERQKGDGNFTSDLATSIYTLHDTNERMIRLVNMLLEASRIDAKTFALRPELFSLSEVAGGIVKNFERFAAASNVSLKFQTRPSLPQVRADRDKISMVIENLVDNAVKYGRGGGEVWVGVERVGDFLRLEVRDKGAGIPEEQQRHIFQKFFRADNAKNKETQGTGMGLYIAKEIIEASQGKIEFKSQERKGSTFWFTLPIKQT